ncbi:autotransporter outer membrane beta-barrel domain-containing protein [Stieleria sp. ICT_E10.1]|uniref:autotransporter family protein n=1 Tax=Stieleria sedimenti TaxID=2976331 RepID=UPI0021801912|nr:autotransporter outer membrane beta-barrel domain-containing protein [Stieleria sedimenti]MCS7468513.1 autotransporter outer membrane beta-barrel domain-containing protein [Stieleria sedimenti]
MEAFYWRAVDTPIVTFTSGLKTMLKKRRLRLPRNLRRCALLAVFGALVSTQSAKSADLVVASSADSGTGSLREALANAASGDRVVFDFAVNTTITLTSDLPSINGDLSFATNNPISVTIDRNGLAAALDLASGTIDPTNLFVINSVDDPDLIASPNTTIVGDGILAGDLTIPGTLSPGTNEAPGTLGTFGVLGDLDLTGGTLQVDLSSTGGTTSADKVNVLGTATLTGANLSIRFNGNQFVDGQTFLVMDAASIVPAFASPTFALDVPDRPFLDLIFDPSLPADQLGFAIQDNGNPFSSVVTGCNQLSAVSAFEDLRGMSHTGVDTLVNSSGEAMVAAANALSGSIYPSLIGAEIVHIQNNMESIRDRVLLQRYPGIEPPAIMSWARAYGVSSSADSDHCQTLGYYQEFGGMEVGVAVSDKNGLSSHAFAHLAGGKLESSGADQHADIESYRGGGSIEYTGESLYLLAAGGAGVQTYDVYRSLAAIEGSTAAQSSFDGSAQFGYFESGTIFSWHAINWIPYLGLHGTRVELDPIDETGDVDFALSNAGGSGDSIRGVLGLGLEQSGGTELGPLTTRIRCGWMHEYLDPNEVFVSSVANTDVLSPLTDRGIDSGRDWGFLRVQLDLFRFLGGRASLAYQGQANSRSSFNALAGGVQWVR